MRRVTQGSLTPRPIHRRARLGLITVIIVASAAAIVIAAALLWRGDAGVAEEIRFEVTGSADAVTGVYWRAPGDGLFESLSPALPWSKTVKVHTLTGPVVLNVMTKPGQSVTCRISVGREVVEETGEMAQCFTTLQRAFAS